MEKQKKRQSQRASRIEARKANAEKE